MTFHFISKLQTRQTDGKKLINKFYKFTIYVLHWVSIKGNLNRLFRMSASLAMAIFPVIPRFEFISDPD